MYCSQHIIHSDKLKNNLRSIEVSKLKKLIPILLLLSTSLSMAQSITEEAFMASFQETRQKYMPVLQTLEALALDGKMDEANQKLINYIPEAERTAVHYFVLGNFLYRIDRKLSYDFQKKAYEMAPTLMPTTLEWGMQQHRKGNYAEALKLYLSIEDKFIPQHHALLADCYINTGQPVKALQAWNMSGHKDSPQGIEYMIHGIYGDDIPQSRRNRILPQLEKKPELINELLLIDLEWRNDWWVTGPNAEALAKDLPLFEKAFGPEDTKALKLSIDLRTEKISPAEFRSELEKLGVILNKGKLPKHSIVAKVLIEDVLKEELATHADLLNQFRKELDYRGRTKKGDFEAWDLLAELQLKVDPEKMNKINEWGWVSYNKPEYMVRYLKKNLQGPDDPKLADALADFPDHPFPRFLKMSIAESQGKPNADLVADVIKAEFKGFLSNDFHSMGDLKAWFMKLEEAL